MPCDPFGSAMVSLPPPARAAPFCPSRALLEGALGLDCRPAGRGERSPGQLAGGSIAVVRALGQRTCHDAVEGLRHARRSGRARRRIIQVGKDRAGDGPASGTAAHL